MLTALANILSGAISIANKVMDAFRDKKLRDEGAKEQQLSDANETLDTIRRVDAPITDADRERVWDKLEAERKGK